MEQSARVRRKKLIRAVETSEQHNRPTCSECTDKLKRIRGCKKPGFNLRQAGSPFVYTSPVLQENGERLMYECPVGFILRQAPHVYDVVELARFSENATPTEMGRAPRYFQQAVRVVSSERSRHYELRRSQNKTKGDANFGAKVRHGR